MSTQAQFETWWKHEGSGMPPKQGEDEEAHVRRICEMAFESHDDFQTWRRQC